MSRRYAELLNFRFLCVTLIAVAWGVFLVALALMALSVPAKAESGRWLVADIGGARAACRTNDNSVTPGILRRKTYITYARAITRLVKKRRKERNSAQRAILRSQIRLLRAQADLSQIICEMFLAQLVATPTPVPPTVPTDATPSSEVAPTPNPEITPEVTPTPTPTSTPQPMRYFDSAGSLTTYGKQQLGVPNELAANIDVGAVSVNIRCLQCHGEYAGRTFGQYRTAIIAPPMYYVPPVLGDNELAHITAYLNRFRE